MVLISHLQEHEDFMETREAIRAVVISALALLPGTTLAGSHFDGDWITHLACEAHGETPAYKWEFPSDNQGWQFSSGSTGKRVAREYLVIEGKIEDNGSAKLTAKGKSHRESRSRESSP